MAYSSRYGTFTSRAEVQNAVLSTLRTWILFYLGEVERQEGLKPKTITPPGGSLPVPYAASYPPGVPWFRGALDFEVWQGDQAPLLVVVCQPTGDAERYEAGKYAQWYEIQAGAIVEDPNGEPWVVQQLADRYGKALMGLLVQQGGLGNPPFAEKTVLVGAPRTEFVDPAKRSLARSVVTVRSLVELVTDESQGPRIPPNDPYAAPGDWGQAQHVKIQVQAEDLTGALDPLTGGAVVEQVGTGDVTVTE